MEENNNKNLSRRDFLRRLGMGAGAVMASSVMGPLRALAQDDKKVSSPINRMTYRVQHGSGEQISLLGFGMMRLPNNQEEVNLLVDYAIEHGVNYFDTAPMYMGGQSEVLTGNALSRHPRDKYYIATKMSNQNQRLWSFEESRRCTTSHSSALRLIISTIICCTALAAEVWTHSTSDSSIIICLSSC